MIRPPRSDDPEDSIERVHSRPPGGDRRDQRRPLSRARFELEGERVDAPAGTFVFVRPGVKRTAFAEESGTTILAVGATPGQVYEPEGSELWAPFDRLYRKGRYAEAADQAREVAEAHAEYPALLYNLACCESLAGRKADAIEHLRLAIERSGSVREYLAEDSDLDPLRGACVSGAACWLSLRTRLLDGEGALHAGRAVPGHRAVEDESARFEVGRGSESRVGGGLALPECLGTRLDSDAVVDR